MKELDFSVEFQNFFCPVTGQKILSEDDFTPSPAMVFCFLHPECAFEHLREDYRLQFAEEYENEKRHGDLYLKLTLEVMQGQENYLWFSHGGPYGIISFCFDMAYKEEDDIS